ncbi:hypothetical protein OQA88_5543 [Cercophora sp. LCS_1]
MQGTKTKILIISDTHGRDKMPSTSPPVGIDVAIHCGDLTDGSKVSEFRATLALLRSIDAPLKLVIAGNHDFTLDEAAYQKKAAEANRVFNISADDLAREYGNVGDARRLMNEEEGITFLDEGIHRFNLNNGARLTVYASPFTPSESADWGFQYRSGDHHDYVIDQTVDIAITHGPPEGILDRTSSQKRGGCGQLFSAIARARPRLHCFGHIHEGWGARMVAWRDSITDNPSHLTDIDNGASTTIESLASLKPGKWDDAETTAGKNCRLRRLNELGYRHTSHCVGDEHPIRPGKATLFVNAAIQPGHGEEDPSQLPWVVDIDLPSSTA